MNAIDRMILKVRRQVLRHENAKYPARMMPVSPDRWPAEVQGLSVKPMAVWRSNRYLAVLYQEVGKPAKRLSVCRAAIGEDGRFADGLTWDELQSIKSECGFDAVDAVEIYPPNRDIVNVSNMRHLWILDTPSELAWRDTV